MSTYHTTVFYNRVATLYEGKPVAGGWQPGWYYEVKEKKGDIAIKSIRGPYPQAPFAYEAMSRDIRSREVSNHLEQLTLEAKEMMLGLMPEGAT